MKLIENQECFAIVQNEKQTYIAIGHTIIAEAQNLEHAREMIEQKDWRLIAGLTTIIARGTLEEMKEQKPLQNFDSK